MAMSEDELLQAATSLMHTAGFRGAVTLHPLSGGANNRVFRVDAHGSSALLKAYFQHPDDPRDRLGTEFAFTSFAWARGVRCIPQPLACDRRHALGVYEFIPGRRLEPHDVTDDAVQQALALYHALNQHRHHPDAQRLPPGSEACFTIADHLECVERRVQRLGRINDTEPTHAINQEAMRFIRHELLEVWYTVRRTVTAQIRALGIAVDSEVSPDDRCLSPSDFGFHNAIRSSRDQKLRFIDFEYAGWDDPAKLVCDFFCQPAVPVSMDYFDRVAEVVAATTSDPPFHRERFRLLLPVYQVKWCCIMLNDFLPAGNARRRFASTAADQKERKARQLQQARAALGDIT